MNTATPRATCAFTGCNFPEGGCAGNCLLHRVDASTLPAQAVAIVTPQGCTGDCRQGRDCTCQVETVSEFSADVKASTVSFWAWSALMWTACWLGIGYFFGRFVS